MRRGKRTPGTFFAVGGHHAAANPAPPKQPISTGAHARLRAARSVPAGPLPHHTRSRIHIGIAAAGRHVLAEAVKPHPRRATAPPLTPLLVRE
jgi:hypothetical protein